MRRELGLLDLVLFNIAAVAGIRWLAAAAHTGPGSITLWVMAAGFFFVPLALSVAALSKRFPEEGGIYVWTRREFGDWHGFLCGWCYWLSNLFYFPSLLLAGVGMAATALGFAENRMAILATALAILWIASITNIIGLGVGKWTGNLGGFSTYLGGALLVGLGLVTWMRFGSATPLRFLPEWNLDKLNFWSQIVFAFGGLELGAILGGEIRNPEKTVARAAWIAGLSIAVFYIAGTLAMLALLPPDQVSVVTGLVQAAAAAGAHLGIGWPPLVLALAIGMGVTGQLGAWIAGSARLPFVIGIDHYLPPIFSRLHPRWRTPHLSILILSGACTVFVMAMQAGENLRIGYQLLVDMTVVTYFVPFLYLFGAAWKNGQRASAMAGIAVSTLGIVLSFVPPPDVSSVWVFEEKLAGGFGLIAVLGRLCFQRFRPSAGTA
ncbi:MAG TPA: APC family permease [Bryobacteraceae bacterium]|nr:APC family permease [Bryobacteraceae bacterium]